MHVVCVIKGTKHGLSKVEKGAFPSRNRIGPAIELTRPLAGLKPWLPLQYSKYIITDQFGPYLQRQDLIWHCGSPLSGWLLLWLCFMVTCRDIYNLKGVKGFCFSTIACWLYGLLFKQGAYSLQYVVSNKIFSHS